ncbi:Serine/threonine-protein kinase 19 [Lemmus lemmus]
MTPGSPAGSAREAVEELARLFPRGLFEDALPPIALRSQVYSLVPDRTVADLQLVRSARETVGGPARHPSPSPPPPPAIPRPAPSRPVTLTLASPSGRRQLTQPLRAVSGSLAKA